MQTCLYCQKEFISKDRRTKYCSRACSNFSSPRKKRSKSCKTCNSLILSTRTYCSKKCQYPNVKYYKDDVSISELAVNSVYKSARWNVIRSLARRLLISLGRVKCEHCGWDKFFEACHIKPVSSFDESSKLSEVNSPDNLLSLCPNCHWLFDHS